MFELRDKIVKNFLKSYIKISITSIKIKPYITFFFSLNQNRYYIPNPTTNKAK